MNALLSRIVIVPGLALGLAFVSAQDAADPYKKGDAKGPPAAKQVDTPENSPESLQPILKLQITAEWIEMKTEDAMPLLRNGQAPNSPELIQKIRDMEKQGSATLVDTVSIVTSPGQRAIAESANEHIYPTEYDSVKPPRLKELNLSGNQLKDPCVVVSAEAHKSAQPNAFIMRPVGARMEVDPVLGPDGKIIDLTVAPELTTFAGTVPHGSVRIGGETIPLMEQPVFLSSKIQTSITLATGQTMLVCAQTPHNAAGESDRSKKWLILIHAIAFPVN